MQSTFMKAFGILGVVIAVYPVPFDLAHAQVTVGDSSSESASSSNSSSGGEATSFGSSQGQSINYAPSSNVEAVDLSETVPNMWAPGLGGGGSNPCVVSLSGAGVGSGFGLSFGRAYNDPECQVRETLRVLGGQLGKGTREAQVFQKNIACQSEMMRKALEQTARETGRPEMACAAVFYPGGKKPGAYRVAHQRSAPRQLVRTPTYSEEVARCRTVSDTAYGACMKRARAYR